MLNKHTYQDMQFVRRRCACKYACIGMYRYIHIATCAPVRKHAYNLCTRIWSLPPFMYVCMYVYKCVVVRNAMCMIESRALNHLNNTYFSYIAGASRAAQRHDSQTQHILCVRTLFASFNDMHIT